MFHHLSLFVFFTVISTDSTEKIPQKLPLHLVSKEVVDLPVGNDFIIVGPDKKIGI